MNSMNKQIIKKTMTNLCAAAIFLLTAIFADAATLTVTNTAVSGAGSLRGQITAAAAAGDTIVFDPTVFASAQTINTSSALAISKNLTITGTGARLLTVRRNTATNFAVFQITAGTVRVSGITVSNGSNQAGGGSAFNTPSAAILTLDSIAATGNVGTESAVGGFSGTITIINSLISNNSVVGVIAEGTINIANSTISGNNGTSVGTAGGIYTAGTVNLNNVTVANNINGGIENFGTTNIRNTIVTGSTVRADTLGAFVSQGNNLISNRGTATGLTQPTDKLNVAANIAALANNGGQTDTHRPNAGSPAIDAGNNCVVTATCGTNNPPALLTTDQRGAGFGRQGGTAVDIGAIEAVSPTAAGVSIGGRVRTADGRGLVNATVYLTDSRGATRAARTSTFGYYRFDGVAAGQTVIMTVVSKRYSFAPRVVSIGEDLSGFDFIADN